MKTLEKTFRENSVRVVEKKKELWFVVTDVCKALGLKNPTESIRNHDKDDLSSAEVIDSMGRTQLTNIVNEAGLYQLIFKSRKKEARDFKKWITHEVLPSIRKTGKYAIPDKLKKLSTKNRNALTQAWKESGVNKFYEYINLTREEYKQLGFEKGKKKKDFDRGELLLLNALESMEMLSLFNDPKEGYYECKDNLNKTAKLINNKTRELD